MSNTTRIALEQRIEAKVERIPFSSCWIWTGAAGGPRPGQQYPIIKIGRSNRLAHRVAYELHRGPIQEGMLVCHTCDVSLCVNHAHLFVGTSQDNVDDMMAKGRHYSTHFTLRSHCQRGHAFTPENTMLHLGSRRCRECHNAAHRRRDAAKKSALPRQESKRKEAPMPD